MAATQWARGTAAALAIAGLVAACGSQASTPSVSPGTASASVTASPTTAPSAARPDQRLLAGKPMTDCTFAGYIAFCGTLPVPEDRSSPSGRQIGIRLVVVPASSDKPAADAFFPLDGGPGGAGTEDFAWLPAVFAGVHATHDIVIVDQRGTGGSNEMLLPAAPDTSGLSATEADARLTAWATGALASAGGDPRFYTSAAAADDIDDVRAALGYGSIDLYGPSYGGTLAQYYIRRHSEHVRLAILDGATPVDVPIFERMPANTQHALDLLLQRCAADEACHGAFPNLAAEWADLVRQLAKPVTTDVLDPATGKPVVVDMPTLAPGIHQALVDASTAAKLPLAIHLAWQGKWAAAAAAASGSGGNGKSLFMSAVIRCSEAWARDDPGEVTRAGAGSFELASAIAGANSWATLCRHLPKGYVSADDGAPVATTLPVLWVTADGDPQDPPANLVAIPAQQPNSRIVTMPVQNHTVGHLGCMPSVIDAFVESGRTAGLDVSCAARGLTPPPAFLLS